jgi:epidermal growth factor receptor substrate 15
MHLVYQALAKRAIPSVLPKELQRPKEPEPSSFEGDFVANFPKELTPVAPPIPAPVIEPLKPAVSPITIQKSGWVLTTIEKLRYDEIFEKSDLDKDGLVSGLEIRDIFLKSGIPQQILAHIW